MSGYTKLFGSILDSTVWDLPLPTKITWITMLAMADMNGEVQASIPGLAKRAHVSIEDCEAALASFMSPDKYSRSKEAEGRRIEEVDGGWRLINHAKYTQKLSASDRRERGAERQKRYRWKILAPLVGPIVVRDGNRCGICGIEFKDDEEIQFDHIVPTSKGGGDDLGNIQRAHAFCNQSKHNIRSGKHGRHPSMPQLQPSAVSPVLDSNASDDIRLRSDADADADQTKTKNRSEPDTLAPLGVPQIPAGFGMFWAAYPRKTKRGAALKAWKAMKPPLDLVLVALSWQRVQPDWTKEGGKYIPYPASYLNSEQWTDEPSEAPRIAPATQKIFEVGANWMAMKEAAENGK